MATKTTTGSRLKLSRPAKAKMVGLLKTPQTSTQKRSLAESKGTYSQYRDKWLKTQ